MRLFGVELEYNAPMDPVVWKALREAGKITHHRCLNFMSNRWVAPSKNPRHKKYWVVKPESSSLLEINSPALADYRVLFRAIQPLMKVLRGSCGRGSGCGFHVHVDVRDVGRPLDLALLFLRFTQVQHWLFRLHPRYSDRKHFCGPVERKDVADLLKDLVDDEENFENVIIAFGSKDTALCLAPYNVYGTVEFRLAPSTDDPYTIAYWAAFCQSFVDQTLKDIAKGRWRQPTDFKDFLESLRLAAPIKSWLLWRGRKLEKGKPPLRRIKRDKK